MRFSDKLAVSYGAQIAESYFKVFNDPKMCGPNFNWNWFYNIGLPGWIETQLFLNIGNNKNWKKYIPVAVYSGQDRCRQLFREHGINEQ
jgi:hypothetical protein